MLSTENAGGLLGTNNAPGASVKVRMLIGTRVQSLGRDVKAGEIVTVSQKDASFLLPYNYATKDLEVESEAPAQSVAPAIEEVEVVEEVEDVADGEPEVEVVEQVQTGKRSGKRR